MLPLAYKSTAAVASALQKDQTATALLTCLKVCAAAFVSVVSAVCLVHFLTLVSNYLVSQITSIARNSFLLFPCVRIHFAAFVSVVSSSLHVSGCKVITFLPTNQIILQKSFIKNCKRLKSSVLASFAVGVLLGANMAKYGVLYMYTRALRRKRKRRKNRRKKYF